MVRTRSQRRVFIIPVLQLRDHERTEAVVKSFIDTDSYREYVEESQGILTTEELLRRVREELRLEKEAHNVTRKELEEAKATIIMLGTRQQKAEKVVVEGNQEQVSGPEFVGEVEREMIITSPNHDVLDTEMDLMFDCASNGTDNVHIAEGSTIPSHDGDVERVESNIAKRNKRCPRERFPSLILGSPYLVTTYKRRKRVDKVPSKVMHGTVVNEGRQEDSLAGPGGEKIETSNRDIVLEASAVDPVGPPSQLLEKAVRQYLLGSFSMDDTELLKSVRLRCKSFRKQKDWEVELKEGGATNVCADYVRGLVNVVPRSGAGDKPDKYCINGIAIDIYAKLLEKRQEKFPSWCRYSIFLNWHNEDMLVAALKGKGKIWDLAQKMSDRVTRLFMPIYDNQCHHWLLLVADLDATELRVYDSSPPPRKPGTKIDTPLLNDARLALGKAFMKFVRCSNLSTWKFHWPTCPEQRNGHDCGVFVMNFMDLLSLNVDGFHFDQKDVRVLRDKCLADILRGKIRNFPDAFLYA